MTGFEPSGPKEKSPGAREIRVIPGLFTGRADRI
jgi:hypothetical protein